MGITIVIEHYVVLTTKQVIIDLVDKAEDITGTKKSTIEAITST